MTTPRQCEIFLHEMLGDQDDLLDRAIEWIKYSLNPEDVFDQDDLERWAESEGYKKSD